MTQSKFRVGAVFPQTEIGTDPGAIRAFANAVEELGFSHMIAFDHVIGANPTKRPDWNMPYTHESMFHEPLVLFSFLASTTKTLVFQTGVIVLPQRQTVLFAKQAACVDIFSGGRIRIGVGIGWNSIEYESLGVPFSELGARLEEQVSLLRKLWTEPSVCFDAKYHRIPDAGISPLPIQRPIPIIFGGNSIAAMKRAARMGDGWLPASQLALTPAVAMGAFRDEVKRSGRVAHAVPVDALLLLGTTMGAAVQPVEETISRIEAWRNAGAAAASVSTMDMGLETPDDHIKHLREISRRLELKK